MSDKIQDDPLNDIRIIKQLEQLELDVAEVIKEKVILNPAYDQAMAEKAADHFMIGFMLFICLYPPFSFFYTEIKIKSKVVLLYLLTT